MVLVLNMVDEARRHGVDVDADRLAGRTRRAGRRDGRHRGRGARRPQGRAAAGVTRPRPVRRRSGDHAAWAHETAGRLRRTRPASIGRVQERLGARRPAARSPACRSCAVVLYVVYLFVGVFGAQTLVGLVEHGLFGSYINPAATALADRFIPWAVVRDFLVGHYGLVTMGLTYAIAIVLPVVATFFLVFGWLEDSGYIPRLAIFSDRIFRVHGAERQGRAADGARPRLRHDGDDDDADPRHAEGAADRRAAAGARHPVLGATGDDPRHPRRHLVLGAADAVRRRGGADVPRGVPGRAGAAGRALRLHHGTAAAFGCRTCGTC